MSKIKEVPWAARASQGFDLGANRFGITACWPRSRLLEARNEQPAQHQNALVRNAKDDGK
jgi:hypothetical protein